MLNQSYFYTKEPIFKNVNKEEFNRFLESYPRKLIADACGICAPPTISYNDFELANRWPYSIVAQTYAYDDDPKSYYYEPEEKRLYRIMTNYQDVFSSKTGNKAGDNE